MLGHHAGYRQTETGTLTKAIQLGETLKYQLALVGWNTSAGIGYGKMHLVGLVVQTQCDAALLGKLGGIV